MEMLTRFFDAFIILPYLATFIFLSYGLRDVLHGLTKKIIAGGMHRKYNVFFIALFVGLFFQMAGEYHTTQLLVTYAVGTSLYELVIQGMVTWVTNKINNDN